MHYTVFAVYAITPVCIVETGKVFCHNDEAFEAYVKERGFTDKRDYSRYGDHIEWWNNADKMFIVDCGKVNNESHATFAAECIARAGKPLA